jgi:beta-1,6-N-acetylglucosaminyltransferase 4
MASPAPAGTPLLLGLKGLRLAFVALCSVVLLTVVLALFKSGSWDEGHYLPLANLGQCELPQGGFRGWQQGVVTKLVPEIAINCSKAIAGEKAEIERVAGIVSSWKNGISDKDILNRVHNCTWLRSSFANNLYNSKLEKSFPLAFTFVVHNSPQQVLRLLRLMYRPQNTYCIHYDYKSPYKDFFHSIAECFSNVVIPLKLERVFWGHYSILAAQMSCMRHLLHHRVTQLHKWEYVINMCGKELPLISMRELVSRLMKLNGTSSIKAFKTPNTSEDMSRIKFRAKLNKKSVKIDYESPLGKPPFDVQSQYYKSEAYVMISYAFANFLMTNPIAINVLRFFSDCKSPEEHFYATMYRWPNAPGGYDPKYKKLYFSTESAFWGFNRKCRGQTIHQVCITNLDDLHEIVHLGATHAFHNKYSMDYDPTAMQCMEARIVNSNKLEYEMECLQEIVQHIYNS